MLTPGYSADGVNGCAGGVPDHAGDSLGIATEDLEVDAGGVGGCDEIGD